MGLTLIAFTAVAYGPEIMLPFVGDDYVFLDRTRDAPFLSLWSFAHTDFGWYRPWSRELHFWLLQHAAGLSEAAFRAAGMVLWLAILGGYAAVARQLGNARVAGIATLGVATLASWGTPLLWISGSQDLWMLVFALATLWLFMRGHPMWALPVLALGLLSKETGAVLPVILSAYLVVIERASIGAALRRTAHLWMLVGVWLALHPTLSRRLLDPTWRHTPETDQRPSQVVILARTMLSTVNLDVLPRPSDVSEGEVLRLITGVGLILAGAAYALRTREESFQDRAPASSRRTVFFGLSWMVVGWLPLWLPSIGWHAYYGCLGVLGAWLVIAQWLQHHPRVAVVTLAVLCGLQWAHAQTPSWDWGHAWYQRRAGNMLNSIRKDLLRRYPRLPPYSRLYFGHIPNNVGLVAGQSPAVRVWYRDGTLQAGFYSWYRPRSASSPPGTDFFFRFDSLAGLVEVRAGPENVESAMASNAQWEFDHEALAMLFVRAGNVRGAAGEFEKISSLRHRADAAVFASVCRSVDGDSARADSLLGAARVRTGLSGGEMRNWREDLLRSMPAASRP